jgi:hypothetical protein
MERFFHQGPLPETRTLRARLNDWRAYFGRSLHPIAEFCLMKPIHHSFALGSLSMSARWMSQRLSIASLNERTNTMGVTTRDKAPECEMSFA